MKKLNRKVFITIFSILSVILLFGIISFNISTYKEEYESVSRNLNFIDMFNNNSPRINNPLITRPQRNDIDNTMIFDSEVYTVRIKNNKIDRIIGHSEESSDFDVESIANSIIGSENKLKIGNLIKFKLIYQKLKIEKNFLRKLRNQRKQ